MNKSSSRVCLIGVSGRMGQEICRRAVMACGFAADASARDASSSPPFPVYAGREKELPDFDVVIDFSSPEGTDLACSIALEHLKPLLVGTTGLREPQLEALREASAQIPVLVASNCSIGVAVLSRLTELAAKLLPEADVEITDIHHRDKKDAPSGTALALAYAVGQGNPQKNRLVFDRTTSHSPRQDSEIGVQSIRGGHVAGDHTVSFFLEHERIELCHRANDRGIFADGAVQAAEWLCKSRAPGMYTMHDVVFG